MSDDLKLSDLDFPDLLDYFMTHCPLLSPNLGQSKRKKLPKIRSQLLSDISGVLKSNIDNWHKGKSSPRHWQDVVRLAVAMQLPKDHADLLLDKACHPSINELRSGKLATEDEKLFLSSWSPPPFWADPPPLQFVGREKELEQIRAYLAEEGGREGKIVIIRGMPGVGKTSLAQKVALQCQYLFPDGALWIDVADEDSLMDVLAKIAKAYQRDVSKLASLEDRAAEVRKILREKRALVFADNIGSLEEVRKFNPGGNKCAIVAIANPRGFEGIILSEMLPIPLQPFDLDSGGDALSLFRKYLDHGRVAEETEFLLEVARLVGGHPFALDLTARHIQSQPLLSSEECLEFLSQQLAPKVLEEGVLDNLTQQIFKIFQSVIKAFSPQEQLLFFSLGAFPEGADFSIEAAASVAGLSISDAKGLMGRLLQSNLVSPTKYTRSKTPTRFRLHSLTRHCIRRLYLPPNADEQMVSYFVGLSSDNRRKDRNVGDDLSNILHALSQPSELPQNRLNFVRGVIGINGYLLSIGLYDKAETLLKRAHGEANLMNDHQGISNVLLEQGELSQRHTDYDRANDLFQQAMQYANDHHLLWEQCEILARWGWNLNEQAKPGEAELRVRESLALAETIGYTERIARGYNTLGVIAMDRGYLDQAESYCRRALEVASQGIREVYHNAFRLNLGVIAYKRGKYADAEQLLKRSLEFDLLDVQTMCHRYLGWMFFEQGDFINASKHWQTGMRISKDLNNVERQMSLADALGNLYLAQGDLDKAANMFESGLNLLKQNQQEVRHKVKLMYSRALLGTYTHKYDDALKWLDEAEAGAKAIEDHWLGVYVLADYALLYLKQGNVEGAASKLYKAKQESLVVGSTSCDGLVAFGYALLLQSQGSTIKALEYAQESRKLLGGIHHRRAIEAEKLVRRLSAQIRGSGPLLM